MVGTFHQDCYILHQQRHVYDFGQLGCLISGIHWQSLAVINPKQLPGGPPLVVPWNTGCWEADRGVGAARSGVAKW